MTIQVPRHLILFAEADWHNSKQSGPQWKSIFQRSPHPLFQIHPDTAESFFFLQIFLFSSALEFDLWLVMCPSGFTPLFLCRLRVFSQVLAAKSSSFGQVDDGHPLIHAAALSAESVHFAQSRILPWRRVWALKILIKRERKLPRWICIHLFVLHLTRLQTGPVCVCACANRRYSPLLKFLRSHVGGVMLMFIKCKRTSPGKFNQDKEFHSCIFEHLTSNSNIIIIRVSTKKGERRYLQWPGRSVGPWVHLRSVFHLLLHPVFLPGAWCCWLSGCWCHSRSRKPEWGWSGSARPHLSHLHHQWRGYTKPHYRGLWGRKEKQTFSTLILKKNNMSMSSLTKASKHVSL